MKILPLAALAAAPLLIAAALVSAIAPASPGSDQPVRLIAVRAHAVATAWRQHPLDEAAAATGALAKFTSSLLTTGPNEARSQISGLSAGGGLVQAEMVTASCRYGAVQSHVAGLHTRAPAGTLTADVRRHNPDGSTTVAGLRLTVPPSGDRRAVTIDIAVATCAAELDRPRPILPGLPARLREALLRQAREPVRDTTACTTALAPSASKDSGC